MNVLTSSKYEAVVLLALRLLLNRLRVEGCVRGGMERALSSEWRWE